MRNRPGGSLVGTGLLGATLLRLSLSRRPGSPSFYGLTFALAATWLAGASAPGAPKPEPPPQSGQAEHPVLRPIATGVGAFGMFWLAARIVRAAPPLHRAVGDALSYADRGGDAMVLLTTWANGVAEELFFRGRLWSEIGGDHPVAATTAAYTAVTAATGNPALVAAAAVMGTIFGRQRRATGGIRAPILTHLTWSTLMVTVLPRVLRRRPVVNPTKLVVVA